MPRFAAADRIHVVEDLRRLDHGIVDLRAAPAPEMNGVAPSRIDGGFQSLDLLLVIAGESGLAVV
jgi:hypothetical protein